MFESLKNVPRLLLEQELRPSKETAFSPPDLPISGRRLPAPRRTADAARRKRAVRRQSSRGDVLDGSGPDIAPELAGLPYVKSKTERRVRCRDEFADEAHRINSPFIVSDSKFQAAFLTLSGYEKGSLSIEEGSSGVVSR